MVSYHISYRCMKYQPLCNAHLCAVCLHYIVFVGCTTLLCLNVSTYNSIHKYIILYFIQEPLILNPCTTSLISSYEVQIDYTNNDGRSTDSRSIPGTISSILMSDYFPGHPLSNTTYNISVIAVNEGGRGIANTPTCTCRLLVMYL